jgi:hypothetical protein
MKRALALVAIVAALGLILALVLSSSARRRPVGRRATASNPVVALAPAGDDSQLGAVLAAKHWEAGSGLTIAGWRLLSFTPALATVQVLSSAPGTVLPWWDWTLPERFGAGSWHVLPSFGGPLDGPPDLTQWAQWPAG